MRVKRKRETDGSLSFMLSMQISHHKFSKNEMYLTMQTCKTERSLNWSEFLSFMQLNHENNFDQTADSKILYFQSNWIFSSQLFEHLKLI